jgi:hypothetical protein
MKLETVLHALSLMAAPAAAGFGGKPPPEAKTTMSENFPWRDPFAEKYESLFEATCETTKTYHATQYTLHDLFEEQPRGLKPWGDGLKKFFQGRAYPGGWEGLDQHLYNRHLLKINYADIPIIVREWIETQDRTDSKHKGLYAVYDIPKDAEDKITDTVPAPKEGEVDRSKDKDKVAIFAPGALYPILPLWVADGSGCKGSLSRFWSTIINHWAFLTPPSPHKNPC